MKAFHANIAKRAAAAGAIAVAENKARQEREDKLIAASEAKAKADAEVGRECSHLQWAVEPHSLQITAT
jgi:hypothetical protein